MCEYDISTPLRKILYLSPRFFWLFTFVMAAFLYANVRNNEIVFTNPETIILEKIFTNVQTRPLKDIQIVGVLDACPDNYETVTLGTWGGISDGCFCPTETIYGRQCKSDETGCVSVAAIPSKDINFWTQRKFCIQRINYYTFLNLTGKCDTGSDLCASGYCAYYNESCPITDVKFLDASVTTIPDGYASVTFNSTMNLIWTNQTAAKPITELDASLYNVPCLDPFITAFSSARSPYPLSVYPENGCEQGGLSNHVLTLTQTPVSDLFSDNSIANAIAKITGYVAYNAAETAFLSGLRQYSLNRNIQQCGPADPVIFQELRYQEDRFTSSTKGLLISAIVANIGIFFIFIVELIIRKKQHPKRVFRLKFMTIFIYLLMFGICVVYIIIGVFGARCKVNVERNLRYLRFLGNNECFEQSVVNAIIKDYQTDIFYFYSIVWLSIALLIVACSGVILAMALTTIECIASAGSSNDYQTVPKKGNTMKGGQPMTTSQMKGSHKKPIQNSSIELLLK